MTKNRTSMFDDYLEEIKKNLPILKSAKLTLIKLNKENPLLMGEYSNFIKYVKNKKLNLLYTQEKKIKSKSQLDSKLEMIKNHLEKNKCYKECYNQLKEEGVTIVYSTFLNYVKDNNLQVK